MTASVPGAAPAAATPLWAPGSATGVGSLPGTDPDEAARLVLGELPDLPHLVELPARGPGAGMIGRAAVLLTGLPVDIQPSGWRLVTRPGRDLREARDLLARDLDALEEAGDRWAGPLKLQAAGPWTLAAALERPRGGPALGDRGAARDIAEALAQGLAEHVAEVRRRLPAAGPVLVQLDEPTLPAVLAGHVATASGFSVVPAVEDQLGRERLRLVRDAVTGAGGIPGLHCCAVRPPLRLAREAGLAFAGVDLAVLRAADEDPVGEAVEAGMGLLLGIVPGAGELSDVRRTVEPVRALWRRLGFPAERLAEVAAVTPGCGLAGASPAYARAAMRRLRDCGRALHEGGFEGSR